ncbi:SEL1-like repeat protein [Wenzhouxiangella sp. EGI_FJ10409]|uniref:SEL1-like repeat protein n=1 Tax=Wenzhouxiangella sp. EGI_FJ10409 TaxID=3243767 RepID=UPI0035E06834
MMMTKFATTFAVVALFAFSPATAESPFRVAEHTPGYSFAVDAQESWEHGRYFDARHRFQRAAWWADKFAQYNLGVIHYRGDGVDRDPSRAWAWFDLAAERDYGAFVEMADAVWGELDEEARRRAKTIRRELEPRYGDEAAVERTAKYMERQRRSVTGSRVGFVGFLQVVDASGNVRSGDEFYAEEKWDFRQVVQQEKQIFDAMANARVSIGEFKVVEDDE